MIRFALLVLALACLSGCAMRVDRSATSGDVIDVRFPAPCDPMGSRGGGTNNGNAGGGEAVVPPVPPVAPVPPTRPDIPSP